MLTTYVLTSKDYRACVCTLAFVLCFVLPLARGTCCIVGVVMRHCSCCLQSCCEALNDDGRNATHVSTQDFHSPDHDRAASATLSTHHQHLPGAVEVHDGVAPVGSNSVGNGDGTITTRAVPETTAGKKKDSLCLTFEAALLPAPMKAGLIVPSPTR